MPTQETTVEVTTCCDINLLQVERTNVKRLLAENAKLERELAEVRGTIQKLFAIVDQFRAQALENDTMTHAIIQQMSDQIASPIDMHPLVCHLWMRWINRRVSKNLEKWGVQDFMTLGLAVCEEAGELAQAILQNRDENGDRGRITQEAIDLAALCIQVMVTMKEKHGHENIMNALFAEQKEDGK